MNKKAFIKEINNDLEKLRKESEPFFTADDIVKLLSLLAVYKRGQEGSNVINLINKLDLLLKDLEKLGENDPFIYVANFIRNNSETKWK